jgi:D-beta-D-heptose 7-phosphate kinase/D-beta-D-heptose 1-phosphate adenosyltransferase
MLVIDEIIPLVQEWKAAGQVVVLATGTIDIYHPGHVDFIEIVKSYGDKLVIGLNADSFVKHKGPDRPIFNEEQRARMVESNRNVDAVFIARCGKRDLINILHPNVVIINGTDTTKDHEKEQEAKIKSFQKQFPDIMFVLYKERTDDISTTSIIKKIRGEK